MEWAVTRVQSEGVLEEESHPSTSTAGAVRQVEHRAQAVRHDFEEKVSGKALGAARVSFGLLLSRKIRGIC